MRLRVAFKLHGEEADLARQLADAANITPDKIAKLAMQRYMSEVLYRAEALMKQVQQSTDEVSLDGRQPSPADTVQLAGTVSDAQDSVPSQEA